MGKLTEGQELALRHYAHGGTVGDPKRVWAPIRRLIARGLIAKTGRIYRGRPYYTITPAGRTALSGEKP